jgi:hypothetical protein
VVAAAEIRVEAGGEHLGQHAYRSSAAMHPSHETGMGIACGVRLYVIQETTVNLGKTGRRPGERIAEASPNFTGDWFPDGTLADVLDIVERVIQHLVSLNPESRPVVGVERFACWSGGIGCHTVFIQAEFDPPPSPKHNNAFGARPSTGKRFMIRTEMPYRPNALSLCMIVKNEERNLPRCLDSVQDLAGELIVVDTGSTDQTPRIAARHGAEVVRFDFASVDFAAARNRGIERASGRWILVLDADETLDQASAPEIERLVGLDENAGYYLERHNHASDSASPTTDYVVRLFPNRPYHRYRGRVHETIDASILSGGGRLRKSGIRIDHSFASDRETRRRKNHWYIEILKEEIAADPSDDSRLDFLAAEYHQLEMFDEATEIAERIAQMRPLDARAHLFVGTYHLLYKPDLAQARADFSQALKLRPGYAEAESFLQLIDQQERSQYRP